MADINVNEYVRTNNGIIAQVINPNYYMEAYIECKEGLIIRDNIVNNSKYIKELIELGDYINGIKVTKIYWDKIGDMLVIETADRRKYYSHKIIHSIVTKEVFAQAEYKIKEDK